MENKTTASFLPACKEWDVGYADEELPTHDEPDPILDMATFTPGKLPKNRGPNVNPSPKRGDATKVWLPNNNAELFAVELRHNFTPGYLAAVWDALATINQTDE